MKKLTDVEKVKKAWNTLITEGDEGDVTITDLEEARETIYEALEEIQKALEDAITAAGNLQHAMDNMPEKVMDVGEFKLVGPQLDSYMIPHLQAWIDDENQCGSVESIKQMLDSTIKEFKENVE